MSKKRAFRVGWQGLVCTGLLLLGLLVYQQWPQVWASATGAPLSAATQVAQVWDNARNSSQYTFNADITMTSIPLATAGNIGRFSKTDSLYLEGTNDLRSDQLQMALWGDGVSVMDRAAAYQVRVADGLIQSRLGDGEWQTDPNHAVTFAPEGDFLAFLDVAHNIALASDRNPANDAAACAVLDCTQLTIYTFDLDGRTYAEKLARIGQEQLVRSGQLPPGTTFQVSDQLASMTGTGELWVDARGLPVRQKVTLSLPPAAGADHRTATDLDIRFTNYQHEPAMLAATPWLQSLGSQLAQSEAPSPVTLGVNLGALTLAVLSIALLLRPTRRTQIGVTVVVLIALVVVPALQAQAATLAIDRLTTQQTEKAAGEQLSSALQTTFASGPAQAAEPYVPPTLNVAAATPSATQDSDSDGLNDALEALLGTSAFASDTDGDTIGDQVEVTGFSFGGKQWYGDPRRADSNNDGIVDGQEWDLTSPDRDGDNTPDLYDFDDDGDGVPDKVDISRLVASKADNGSPIIFTQANPLQLTVDGLNGGSYSFVDLQLRPTNPERLWYAFNVLNWPKDEKGNVQDWDSMTFFDYCKRTGGSDCTMSPDDNGDIKLVPMLEVTLPDLNNLPRQANGTLDKTLLQNYGIVIQPAGDGSYLAYVPLTLVEDPATGSKVAFQGQMIYQAGSQWRPQAVRLAWSVNLLNEQYTDPEAAKKVFATNGGKGTNQNIILHAYYDEFQLTGLNVREDRGVDMAIVYEDPPLDPARNDDDALFQMTRGLEGSFFTNRDCDFLDNTGKCVGNGQRDITIATIAQRWNHPTNDGITDNQRWGIGDYLRVETRSFATQDEATMIAGQQMAPQILDTHFKNVGVTAPALLYVRESRMRTVNADGRNTDPALTWSDRQIRVNFASETVMALGSYNLAPYRYNTTSAAWEAFPTAAYIDEIIKRYSPDPSQSNVPAGTIILAQAEATYTGVQIAINIKGENGVLSTNASSSTAYSSLGNAQTPGFVAKVFSSADLSDEELRFAYINGIGGTINRLRQLARVDKLITDETLVKVFGLTKAQAVGDIDDFRRGVQEELDFTKKKNITRGAVVAAHSLLAVGGLAGLLAIHTPKGKVAGEAILYSVNAVGSVIDAAATAFEIKAFPARLEALAKVKYPKLDELDPATFKALVSLTNKQMHGINLSGFKIGAVGAAIGIGISWGIFFGVWGSGVATGSVQFNRLLAGAIAGTVFAVMTFLISLTVVGAIVMAIFAFFDLFAFIACKAGAKKACDLGITEAIIKVMTDWLYTGGVMIDTSGKPPIATVDDIQMRLSDPARGLVAGNGLRFEAAITTLARHAAPDPGPVYFYPNFFTDKDIRSTSVRYAFGPQAQKLKTTLNQTIWSGWGVYSFVETAVPSPVVGWLVPVVKSKDLWQAIREDRVASPVYPLATPQINQNFPLTLSIGLALPTYDCWFQVCQHKSAQSTTYQNLSKNFVLDVLPATITDFVNWHQLGVQLDPDGDGLLATVDPNNRAWDSDNDGLPDKIELDESFDPRRADADNDGLSDSLERRYGVNQWRADTDGDGLTDIEEINGYPLTLGGRTLVVTSDPTIRDSDGDGMSDSVERRLNGLDATRYPFHPGVYNDPPVRLYTALNDADRVLAVGAGATVTTTVMNGTAVANALVAAGVFSATLPAQLGGATQRRNFTLLPTTSAAIVLNGTAAATNGAYAIKSGVAADLATLGTTPAGVPDDILFDNASAVTIDSDQPNLPALTQGAFVQPGRTVVIGGAASDPTSYIANVAVSANGSAFNPATGTGLWAYSVEIPNNPTGVIPITVRAADAVNNTNSANFNLTIDGNAPALSVNLNPGESRQVHRDASGAWTLHLTGTASDALAGVDTLTVQIGDSSNAIYTSTVINNGNWSIDYVFDDPAFNADPRPTGNYTLTVTARDKAIPDGNPTSLVIPFVIDMTPPTVTLLSHKAEMQLTDGTVLTGTVSDAHSPVQSVEIAFVAASTVLSTGNTLLNLPLNDLPATRLFANNAGEQSRIYCIDATCPTSGNAGAAGTAAAFDGNDLLRTFDPLDLPESGLTTALWFKTTCANCGLFSATQGVYPASTERDRELFLDTGKVCSSILLGANREIRCSAANSYADGNWHQVVHTLGANGNALYVDGQLAVSSPTTASSFTAQDGVLIGYAPSAATPFLTGALDEIIVYDGALAPASALALYRQWQPVAFSNGQWAFTVPPELEGYYQIDMRASDVAGNYGDTRGDWPQFRGPIDTKFPTFAVNVTYSGSGSAAQTTYVGSVRDINLTTTDYRFTCDLSSDQLRYNLDPTQLAFAGDSDQLMGIEARCVRPGFQSSSAPLYACDAFNHCGAVTAPQTVAYLGTRTNRLQPTGTLPNAIERTVLSDPDKRVQIIQRPGQVVTDIAIDESHGKLYWGEMQEGAYAQPGQIWRANLDGSAQERLVSGLTVYAPEALQIAVDPVGNKLYWTKGYQLWWANLDGTQPQMVYEVPADPGFGDGGRGFQHLGDVAIDQANGYLYLAERRPRWEGQTFNGLFNHSLIVRTQLNGTAPSFVAGAGTGCNYANFYDNLGRGVGAGKQPTLCVQQQGGMDVEALFVVAGDLYWAAFDEGFATSAVYKLPVGGNATQVAPLALGDNSLGRRSGPLPQLYVAVDSVGVFAMLEEQVVRGEPGGEFTQFSVFNRPTPGSIGAFVTRGGSRLTALAVIRTPQTIQSQADLAVALTSPDLVLVNGQTGRYNVQVNNNSALPANSVAVSLTLPAGATYAGATVPGCSATGAVATCTIAQVTAGAQQSIGVSFTIAVNTVQPLTATVQVAHATADANPTDNRATHSNLTAAPTPTALGGLPYLYGSYLSRLVRVPLFGNDRTPELVDLYHNGYAGFTIAADTVRNKLILNNYVDGALATINPDGTGYTVIAATTYDNFPTQPERLSVAVDEAEGRIYWTQINSYYLSAIKSAKLDGSDVITHVAQILNQRGLVLDPVRRQLFWVATDRSETQNIIYRSNLDGSGLETVYAAPPGRQLRYLTLNPYSQKLYWIDPLYNGGALFWADSDGGQVVVLQEGLGEKARGLVVQPASDSLYFTRDTWIVRSKLDGSDVTDLANFNGYLYPKVTNRYSASFLSHYLFLPDSNLTLALAAPFPPPPCTVADGNEPNDTQAQATAVGVGSFSAALCRSVLNVAADQDVYSVTVPSGQQITVTLQSPLDRNLDLYLQAGDFTADLSNEPGRAVDTVTAANYDNLAVDYFFTVINGFAGSVLTTTVPATNTVHPYTITVALATAPQQTSFTNAQCAAVDSHDAPGAAGNGSQVNATALTVGTPITGALCYELDQDYYKFSGVAGQSFTVDLPVRPADYPLYVYRPDGSLFNGYSATGVWRYGTPFTLDATGEWAVAVADPNLIETLVQYQLLVSDVSCAASDSYEPNNAADLATDINGQTRVFASLCSASDQDYYQFTATAGQALTVNYPYSDMGDGAGGNLLLQSSTGATLAQIAPGTQGSFTLVNGGSYRFLLTNSNLSGSDVPYMFQWLLDAPTVPAAASQYVYYADYPHLVRVALSSDHTVEPILIDGGASGEAIAAAPLLGKLFLVESSSTALVSVDFNGHNRTVIVPDVNPDNVNTLNIAVAVDELGGHVYWLQPQGPGANSTATKLMRANLNGSAVQAVLADLIYDQHGLFLDPIKGYLYWVANEIIPGQPNAGEAIYRSRLDGSGGAQLLRGKVTGQQVRDLALDPWSQKLYWLDPGQQTLFRANSDGSSVTALRNGLSSDARGLALQPFNNALYYSSGGALQSATLDGSATVTLATLSGQYQGPSNLNPTAFLNLPVGTPDSNLVLGQGSPILSPCAVADSYEPNNTAATATPLTVSAETVVYGALCNTTVGQPTDTDYFTVTVPDQKTLAVTLTDLPADYRLVILHPAGYAAAFSENAGLAAEAGTITNTSGVDVVYTVLVLSGLPIQNVNQYKLTLTLGNVPPPPDPTNDQCGFVDPQDTPGIGNGTLATATALNLGTPSAGALCYSNDVDMYAFDGLAGQTVTIDLPIRPQDYALTLYDPSGTPTVVISATTTPTYGGSIQLAATGRYTISVAQPNLTPTTAQYQLLVGDANCAASDAYEPNNTAAYAATLSDGSRVHASLCSSRDMDLYHFSASAGQELTLNYPVNATGAGLRLSDSSGEIGVVSAGGQGKFTLSATGTYTLSVANNGLTGAAVPYGFQLLLGAPTTPPTGLPYIYYSRAVDLIRADVTNGSVEPLLTTGTTMGGAVIAADNVRGKLYILTNDRRIDQVNFDGTQRVNVVASVNPNGVLRPTEALAVDELSGRIYWTESRFGVVVRILSANGDGSDVQEVIPNVVYDHGLTIDSVAGLLYWAATNTQSGVDVIWRSNLDGSNSELVYSAPADHAIRELAHDPFAQKLYWRDPNQNRLFWLSTGASEAAVLRTVGAVARGFVVRALVNELYFSDGSALYRAALDGSNAQAVAQVTGAYNGLSNLDANVFYPTTITPPGTNLADSNLALGFSQPFAQPCSTVDGYEPNDSAATAAAIGVGTITAALCTRDLEHLDTQDFYMITVAAGQQISVALTQLPQNYGLALWVGGQPVAWNYQAGLQDKTVVHVNNSTTATVYTILVERFGDTTSSRIPYSLTVAIGAPPPPPPPPPPPADACAPYDSYDQPGLLGNGSRSQATPISFNTPITAALCYAADKDYYSFDGQIGQNVTIDLPTRPADYYVSLYNPVGDYVTGIFPGSWLGYGGSVTLNATGRWSIAVWSPNLAPTTDQYQLRLGVNAACSGRDPYEPNNEEYNPYVVVTTTLTLQAMLCEQSDTDFFSFPLLAGQRIKITPRILTPGMTLFRQLPGTGFYEDNSATNQVVSVDGNYILGIHSQETQDNLPYVIDIEILPVPTATPLPNNWSCAVYPSSDIPQRIEDLATLGSTVNVPTNGTVTHVGIKDLTFDHGALWNLTFGLQAPDGTQTELLAFDDYGFYTWCGGSNCRLALDDAAIEGLIPPQFPNTGGTYRPSRNSFAPFNGKASNGIWTLLINDNFAPEPGDSDAGDTTGNLISWGLEVCVDNGNPATPPPTATATPTPEPQPANGTPIPTPAPTTPTATPTPAPTVCVVTNDAYEEDDTAGTAALFDQPNLTSGVHTFDSALDADWMKFTASANRQYTFVANVIGGTDDVALVLFASNGANHLLTSVNSVTFTPSVAGDYYLRAQSAAGITQPCGASYSVGLTVVDPNATPVPTPDGGVTLPAGHDAPPRSAAILAPVDGAVVSTTQAVAINVGLNADNGIQSADLLVDGTVIDSYTAAPNVQDATWSSTWTPTQAGVYTLTAVIVDSANVTATSPANVIYVDLADPTVSIVAETITLATLMNDGTYPLHGTASDDSQVATVEVRFAGGLWQPALLDGATWSFALAPSAVANPDGGTLAIEVRVTDKAGRTATTSANVLVDVTPPDVFASTTTLVSGAVITPSQVITDLNVRLAWPAIAGATSVYAGWTMTPTATLAELAAYGAGAGTHDQTLPEGSALYAHVIAVDANGNQRATVAGPFYVDTAPTPDQIRDLGHATWVASGGKQVGQMNTGEHGLQKLFAGWDADGLRLRWQGVALNNSDLYFYLGTGGGGSTDLYNPAGPGQSSVLPFAANYLVRLSAGITPTLLAFSGSGWITQTTLAAASSGDLNDVLLPFPALGITNPAGATLKVLGVAAKAAGVAGGQQQFVLAAAATSEPTVWATIPDQNLGRTWTQYIEFASLGAGIVPANGVWADAQLAAVITADPTPANLVGVGDAISVTVTIQNGGSAGLPQLIVAGTTTGGVALDNVPQVASNIPPSGTVALTLNGIVNGDGTVALTLADSYHRPYLLETLTYQVDVTPPVNVSVGPNYANPGLNTALGFAQDDSPLGQFDLEVNGVLSPCQATGSSYQCEWNAGNAGEGTIFTLRGRATDVHGNQGWSNALQVTVDATPPQLVLSAAALAALSDGRLSEQELSLTGTLVDATAAANAQLCLTGVSTTCTTDLVQPDSSWALAVPALGDGVATTLTVVGYDEAGNVSQPVTATVLVDSVGPQLGALVVNPGVVISPTAALLASGTVTDGDEVGGVQIYLVKPNLSTVSVPAILNGANWTAPYFFDQTGVYMAVVVATDRAGNVSAQSLGLFNATAMAQAALLTVNVVGNGTVSSPTGSYPVNTVVPITATAGVGWSFAHWSGDLATTANPTTITLDGNKAITATFTQNAYTVSTATVGNGTIQLEPQQASYAYGQVITVTATAATGSAFSGWSGAATGNSNPVTLLIDGNKAITGTFTLNGYRLTVNQTGNGSGNLSNTPAGSTFPHGTVVTLTATANPGSAFGGWSGAVSGNTNPVTLVMDGDKTVTGAFTLNNYSLTLSQSGNGAGTLSSSPSGTSFPYGTVVTLTANPNANSSFTGWSGAVTGIDNPITLVMDGDKAVTGAFGLNAYSLTVQRTGTGSGSVTNSPSGTNFPAGTVVTLTATSSSGSFFTGWSGAVTGISNPVGLVIDSNKTVTATFMLATKDNIGVREAGTDWKVDPKGPLGTLGYYNMLYTFTNKTKPARTWRKVYIKVVEARNAVLLNPTDGTPGGVGERILIPDSALPGGDNLWQVGERLIDQHVQVGVTAKKWQMKLAIYGTTVRTNVAAAAVDPSAVLTATGALEESVTLSVTAALTPTAVTDLPADQPAEEEDEILELIELEEIIPADTIFLPFVAK